MSERSVIQQTIMPVTKEKLIEEFGLLGLKPDDVVIVHTSLSKLGFVIGGAVTVIQALREVVADGVIIMPTQTGDNSNPEEWKNPAVPSDWVPYIKAHTPAFDPDVTPSRGMGKVPELFRTLPGVKRTTHPMDSFAYMSKQPLNLNQPLSPAFGDDSPLAYLVKQQGKVLLIGVGYDVCTLLHHAETKVPNAPRKEMQTSMLQGGQRAWVTYEDFDYGMSDYNTLGYAYEKQQKPSIRRIGKATIRLIDAASLVAFAIPYIETQINKQRTS
jgi:aminoglycoside 3-N-acetyltransferase